MLIKRILYLLVTVVLPVSLFAQVTTSNLSGSIHSNNKEALTGASIKLTHIPTGTVYTVVSRVGGRYALNNMTPGGPYRLEVTFVGYNDIIRADVFLTLGETAVYDFTMDNKSTTLENVIVSGRARNKASSGGGTETNIGRDKIANLPSVGRNLNDFVRFTPQVKVTSVGGISIAGQNNRYNSFMIDGAVSNDVFGVSEQATNGGRAGVPPISLDAIDQIVVQISPYDASLGNFTGGGINAITRSGSNNFSGSVYTYFRNKDLARKNLNGVELSNFQNKTFGFRVGGPIITNKMFYFLNAELQDDNRPQPFDTSSYRGNSKSTQINGLIDYLKKTYQYDPGDYINNPDLIKRKNITARIDWNLTLKHKLSLSYRWTDAERTNPGRSSANTINFFNGAEFFPSTTHSGTAELNTRISNSSSNLLRLSFTRVVDDRAVTGKEFPNVSIRDGSASGSNFNIVLGSEISSTANLLKQSVINLYDVYKLNKGSHNFSFGTDNDFNKSYNLFMNRNFGFYEYNSLADFMTDKAPRRYRREYSLVDPGNKSGDANVNVAADFGSIRLGLFFNDDIKFNNNFTLTVGIRADYFKFLDKPATDEFFRDVARPIISQQYDLRDAQSGKMGDPSLQVSPRVGFKYNIPEERVTLRGGIGVFTGRTPLVWPGGAFQQTAVTIGAVDTTRSAGLQLGGQPLTFQPDVNKQYTQADFGLPANLTIPQGSLTIIAKKYKMPAILRTSFAIDKKIGNDWTFTIEGMYSKNIVEVDWVNVNLVTPTQKATGPDDRLIYPTTGNKIPLRNSPNPTIQNPYSNIILLQNTKGKKKGFSYSFTGTIDKVFKNGWAANLNYTYGESVVNNEGTSSINASNWTNMESVYGRNYLVRSNSDFSIGHRINAFISKKITYAKGMLATTLSVVYNGQSGSPFSYTLGSNGFIGDGVFSNDLPYIPASRAELDQMVFNNNNLPSGTLTPAQQRDALWKFIEGDKYLSTRKGQYVERNGARLPFTNILDLKLQQDINFKVGTRSYGFQVTWDIFNFTNLINKDWGRQYFLNFDAAQLYSFGSYQTGTTVPTYTYTPITGKVGTISDGIYPFNSSRWGSQIGVRFNF